MSELENTLLPESDLAAFRADVIERDELLTPRTAIDLRDPTYGAALVYYLLLTNWSSLLGGKLSGDTQVFYNRYYWFSKFVRLHESKNGPDAGLEQQQFQIVENHPAEIDWDLMQAIELRLKEEVPIPGDQNESQK